MKKLCLKLLMLLCSSAAGAVQMPYFLDMEAGEASARLTVKNDTAVEKTYSAGAEETAFPKTGAAVLDAKGAGVRISPAQLRLQPGQSGAFTIARQGAAGATERYFRIAVTERDKQAANSAQGVQARFPVTVKTSLILRPAKPVFNYQLKDGSVLNTGNSYFLLMQDEQCGAKPGSTHLVGPGQSQALDSGKSKLMTAIAMGEEIRIIKNDCQ